MGAARGGRAHTGRHGHASLGFAPLRQISAECRRGTESRRGSHAHAHPGYTTTRLAREFKCRSFARPHDRAHAAALAASMADRETLALCSPGTAPASARTPAAVGPPGCSEATGAASPALRPFALPGGERAQAEPGRACVFWETGADGSAVRHDTSLLRHAWERGVTVRGPGRRSSFDAAAALLGPLARCRQPRSTWRQCCSRQHAHPA